MKTGVIIARFQTPFLHEGHIELISKVKENHNRVVIVLGVSPIIGKKNPFDYYTRETMIKAHFPDIVVLPLKDQPQDNRWSATLDDILSSTFNNSSFVLYGSRDSFIPCYSGKYETVEMEEHGKYNATELREKASDRVMASEEFRSGIIYGLNSQYSKAYPTVDIALFKNSKKEILLGRKAIEDTWRLIGGFVDPEDPSYEVAAKRELQEEAGDMEISEFTYELSMQIDDWRYRNERDKIITTLFSCDYIHGVSQANDDIVALQWVEVSKLNDLLINNKINPAHRDMIAHLYNKYNQ